MGNIEKRQRKSGHSWTARTRIGGKSVQRTFARKFDAEGWLDSIEVGKRDGTAVSPHGGRTLYGDWLDSWVAGRHHLRAASVARDESILRNHVRPRWAARRLGEIERAEVARWVADMVGSGLAASSVRKAYTMFAASMEDAVVERLIGTTPCRKISLPKIEPTSMRILTPAELARLADAIDQRYAALVLVGGYGGLRIGELAGLHRDDVDLARRQVRVARNVSWVRGHLNVNQPKTAAGRRRVGLPKFVAGALSDHLDGHAGAEIVFPAPAGGYLDPGRFRRRVWNPATSATGLDGLRPHDLRHTAVSLWIAAGADVKRVAARAGHSSVAFTLQRYGDLYPDSEGDLMERLDTFGRGDAGGDVVPLRTQSG